MTEQLFGTLKVCHDICSHSAAMNMSIDEALLESTSIPSIRFYGWRSLALSFGYFGRFSDLAIYAAERDLVRRWTGGGFVLGGGDLPFSIVVTGMAAVFYDSSIGIYARIHAA